MTTWKVGNNNTNTTIPKTIHQIWLGNNQAPCQWMAAWMHDYVQANPEWTYRLWRTEDIEALHLENSDIFALEPHPANKADIARYEILYRYGGVFIDADSMWINGKSLDPLLQQASQTGLFFGEEVRPGKMTAPSTVTPILAVGVIGCAQHHPAMAHVVRTLGRVYRDLRFTQGVARWEATGPDFATAALRGVPKTVFPTFYFFPGGWWGTDVGLTQEDAERVNPDSYMYQFGYSTGDPLDTQIKRALASASASRSAAIKQCLRRFGDNAS
ncbi:hypothetical protein PTSG_05645 [Salpingoeca rosetta]|uniref:Uncharacterized protein n=1 Tax=Salpingoeca rosetta (strain ATCC 50818 / BSB-021) TaxID=946362 RepID=F2UBT4_SALR5|nr:uncharacterized protein PTSG_05645 [Salpingoeca rosetta]EGD73950.1 hypothetical protein PTSG_05645 [Salpingoeca rosetta]|eukprot:XP_004993513.1 hypothetical protein PTSG_05645 [Salpingoeca rosetta]